MTNYFASGAAAERYARSRPNFHPLVVERMRAFLELETPLALAVDVGCGTGLSTVALTAIAREVVGVDPSEEMLARATRAPGLRYLAGSAAALPLPDASADLLTVSNAFHWFDRAAFLSEARRVVRPAGYLVIYTNNFCGEMTGEPTFQSWVGEVYARRYPTPNRDARPLDAEEAARAGLHSLGREEYMNTVTWSREELAGYLTTHSNMIAAIEGGRETLADARAWLHGELAPFFVGRPEAELRFGGQIDYFQVGTAA